MGCFQFGAITNTAAMDVHFMWVSSDFLANDSIAWAHSGSSVNAPWRLRTVDFGTSIQKGAREDGRITVYDGSYTQQGTKNQGAIWRKDWSKDSKTSALSSGDNEGKILYRDKR